ncbi:Pkinase-domain-containing protein [Polyplosphaeria fusca]|uniref:Pkinase-domain-containing protein n=1 Tax=Polyplosphaeria fusca TaxID=682080 RepID=A0A9P4R4E6_9PLEO|nr:Pkinase-domain-containing protein [Polyplosphaeria fusca]
MYSLEYPLSSQAILLPTLALPAVILDLPPLLWHIRQRNVAAWSLILWLMIINFFNFINPLIWPRDNVTQWWDGNVLCDIEARMFVGFTVALAAASAMVMRKLAKVMDTRNITVTTGRGTKAREFTLDIIFCWGYPCVLMLVYYVVQSNRYFIFAVSGCVAAYTSSWPSAVFISTGNITTLVATYFAVLLVYRLYKYRRDFPNMLAANSTNKSRFLRLAIMSLILVVVYLPFSFFVLWENVKWINDSYSWGAVHGSEWNTVIMVPTGGIVRYDKWAQIATGYLAFVIFGTGSDANNTYKKMMCAIGLGRIFPSLYRESVSRSGSPSGSTPSRGWYSSATSKAKDLFSKNMTVTETVSSSTRNASVADAISPTSLRSMSHECQPVSSNDQMLPEQYKTSSAANKQSFLGRLFTRRSRNHTLLPVFVAKPTSDLSCSEKSPMSADPYPPETQSRAWVSSDPIASWTSNDEGVRVVHEVRQDSQSNANKEKNMDTQIEIRGSEEFYLGRSSTFCRHHWADPVISNKHLRIHCVLYEVDGNGEIPPLVYATDISANGTYLTKKNPQCASSQGRGIRMGSTKGAFLLDDGDELRISDSVTLTYHPFYLVDGERLTHVQEEEKKLMSSQYLITERLLGRGGYGKVFVAIQQSTQRQVACKIIDLHRFSPASLQPWKPTNIGRQHGQIKRWPTKVRNCFREIDILQHVYHPNIISLEKVYWSSNSIYIFQELVTGGDLFSYIHHKGGRLCEVETAVIIQQVLKGVEYLHGQDIIHRDLKPDNILMTSFDDGARIVITDFGNARFVPTPSFENRSTGSPRRMFSLVGTLEWSAPEIHKMNRTIPEDYGYSKSIDMWSIGAITTTLLSGLSIFDVQTQALTDQGRKSIILARMAQCDLNVLDDLSDSIWSKIGPRPKDLIKRLLVLREQSRLTATEALQHPWFSSEYYKAEFDALYLRATRNWKPRRKVFRLIEPIPTHVVGNERNSLSGDVLSQEAVSRYFAPPPRKSSLYDVREGLNVLQHRESKFLQLSGCSSHTLMGLEVLLILLSRHASALHCRRRRSEHRRVQHSPL